MSFENINIKDSDPEVMNLEMFKKYTSVLEEYCRGKGMSFEAICEDFNNREKTDDWKLEMEVHETESPDLIKKYYSTTRMYLYELSLQECRWDYNELFASIARFAKKKNIGNALDFGGGIGGLTICLNSNGIRCDYADIPGDTWDYAGYRIRKERVQCSQLTSDALKERSSCYDLIVSLDCLEHLKPLPDYIDLFSLLLRKGGFLLVKSAFFGEGVHLGSNHKYDSLKTFNEVVRESGLKFKGQLFTRMKTDFLMPPVLMKLLKQDSSSGRKLLYMKS